MWHKLSQPKFLKDNQQLILLLGLKHTISLPKVIKDLKNGKKELIETSFEANREI